MLAAFLRHLPLFAGNQPPFAENVETYFQFASNLAP
jgi:hypothetical protein